MKQKNQHAVALAKRNLIKLTPKQRKDRASKAGKARWENVEAEDRKIQMRKIRNKNICAKKDNMDTGGSGNTDAVNPTI